MIDYSMKFSCIYEVNLSIMIDCYLIDFDVGDYIYVVGFLDDVMVRENVCL